ncbi:MAG: hypothetical protein V3T99_00920 [Nitrososphaerales archaeon]
MYDLTYWFRFLELPFLFLCVLSALLTAKALKGGAFGRGLAFIAWGFLVMAIGHLHMQIDLFFEYNLFAEIFGKAGGTVVWVLALVATWTLSGIGFYKIYSASKGE